MPSFASKHSSENLTPERMRSLFVQLPKILERLFGDSTFTFHYGWGTNLHGALLYIPMDVSTKVLPYFLEDSIDQGIAVPGDSDLFLTSPNKGLDLLFCHESDIHVDGEDEELMLRFTRSPELEEIRFYTQAELEANYPERKH